MLSFKKQTKKKNRAQAMVEFALALPILLLVVYGLLETGRLLFIYASTVTAARQAVRYGSATGLSGAGVPYYEDCDGIRGAVNNVGFINTFSSIDITYDHGPDSPPDEFGNCNPTFSSTPDPINGDRITVGVTTDWAPIVPIVPLGPLTIRAQSSRTILVSVSIVVTAPPQSFIGTGGGTLQLTVTPTLNTYDTVGQQIPYTYQISNTGTGDLLAPFTFTNVADPDGVNETTITDNCAAVAPVALAPSASFTCNGYHTIRQEDLDTGFVTSLTSAGDGTGSFDQDGTTVILMQRLGLNLVKTGSTNASSVVGTVIDYQYVVTNTGNVAVTGLSVNDDKINSVSCAGGSLAPGAQATCTGSYELKQADINRGTHTNRATASAQFGTTPVTSNQATFTVYTPPIYLAINLNPPSVSQPGPVAYTYNLANNTNGALSGPFTITDNRYSVTCPQPGSLGSGSSIQCSATYNVTQADIDAGTAISNTAQASATSGNRTVESNPVSASLLIVQDVSLTLGLTASPTTVTATDPAIAYTYTITNTGKVTLYPAAPTDTLATSISCTGSGALAPGAQRVCNGARPVSDADRNAGSLTNQATVQYNVGTAAGRTASATSSPVTVLTYDGPRLSLTVTPNLNPAKVADLITFTYLLKNTGSANLGVPYNFTSNIVDTGTGNTVMTVSVNCALAKDTLAPGESTSCTGEYTPGQEGSFENRTQVTAANKDDAATPPPAVQTVTPFTVNPPPAVTP